MVSLIRKGLDITKGVARKGVDVAKKPIGVLDQRQGDREPASRIEGNLKYYLCSLCRTSFGPVEKSISDSFHALKTLKGITSFRIKTDEGLPVHLSKCPQCNAWICGNCWNIEKYKCRRCEPYTEVLDIPEGYPNLRTDYSNFKQEFYYSCDRCAREYGSGARKEDHLRFLHKCPDCGIWSCNYCWNSEKGKCLNCAPSFQPEWRPEKSFATKFIDSVIFICSQCRQEVGSVSKKKWRTGDEKKYLVQCSNCGKWVCGDCWNEEERGCRLCKPFSPPETRTEKEGVNENVYFTCASGIKNEVGTEIPNQIVSRAKALGCHNHQYIYEDGKYGDKFPASNLGGYKPTRFRNMGNANKYKVIIEDNWVVFQSPSYAKGDENILKKRSVVPNIEIKRGFSLHGDMMKYGVKITNNTDYKIYDIDVKIRSPEALNIVEPKNKIVSIRSLSPGASETAIFMLKPTRCVTGSIKGTVEYEDPVTDKLVSLPIRPKQIESICPFIEPYEMTEKEFVEESSKMESSKTGFSTPGTNIEEVLKIISEKCKGMYQVNFYDCDNERLYFFSGKSKVEDMIYLLTIALKEEDGATNIAFKGYASRKEGLIGFVGEQTDIIRYALYTLKGAKEIVKMEVIKTINIIDSVTNRCNIEIN